MTKKIDKFIYKKKYTWEFFNKNQIKNNFKFAEEYKIFLNNSKTEREAIEEIIKYADKYNKKIFLNKNSCAAIYVKGQKPISEGLRIVISHVDSPRLDLKQIPLFEDNDSNIALFETHYYGGIKKFQWLTIPLSLHGIIIKKDVTKIRFSIGEDEKDPVFHVPDILPHLSHDIQDTKKMNEAIKGENLDIVVGSIPDKDDDKNKIKNAILKKLNEDYGIIEEDFISAELEAVPTFKARDIGFDRSLVGSYGQDDRSSAFCSLKSIIELKKPKYPAICLFVDKEEIGSEGVTSAQSTSFLRSIIKQIDKKVDIDNVMLKSKVISADVDAAVTPNYTEVFELKNSASLGFGVTMSKFTGHGGKYSANDASAEYVSEIRTLLNNKKIPWQTGELGKVDKGGGGTVAKYYSRLGMEVIDLGPPVLSMHSPYEITSKVDIFSTYLAYKAFFEK